MTLQDIFDQLATGEFHAVGITNDNHQIETSEQPRVLNHINLALSNLYSRFSLSTRELILEMSGGQGLYLLDSKHAVSNTASTEDKYIIDNAEIPFTDDLMAIAGIYDENGTNLPFNENGQDCSLYTPQPNVLQVGCGAEGDHLFIIYKAFHPKLTAASLTDPSTVVLELPDVFQQALLYYVAFRLHSNRLKEGSPELAAQFRALYEQECLQLTQWGLVNEDTVTNKDACEIESEGWA